jgi:hypothetical protein
MGYALILGLSLITIFLEHIPRQHLFRRLTLLIVFNSFIQEMLVNVA